MILQHNYWTGHLSQRRESLKRSISQYINHHEYVKIGITCNPQRRVKEYSYNSFGWDKMVVLYSTSSLNHIRQIEAELVEYNWDYVTNEIGGGGGACGYAPYYLYVVVKN